MDNQNPITRRALLRAAAPAAAAVAMGGAAAPAVADAEPTNLMELARRFAADAKRVDPSIIGSFVGTDELLHGPVEGRVNGVFLSRRSERVRPMTSRKPTQVQRAIRAHRKAREALNDCCDAADEVSPAYGGPAAEAVWEQRNRAEDRKLMALLRIPASGSDAQERAAYLLKMHNGSMLDDRHYGRLLRTLAGVL